jgi:FecR-like protein
MAIHFHVVGVLLSVGCFMAPALAAATLPEGHVSKIVRDVRIATGPGPMHPASVNQAVSTGTIRTGSDARAEVNFADQTVLRLGDNTTLQVDSNTRTFALESGAVLAQAPSGVGATTLNLRSVTATTTGTTLIAECLPKAYIKFISLDGTSRLCLKRGSWATDCVLLRAGQMIIANPDPKSLPEAVDVDLHRLLDTCQFITEFRPLPGRDRLTTAAAAQMRDKSQGTFAETNLVIFGRGTLVTQKNAPAATPARTAAPNSSASRSPHRQATPAP